jgi:hypothetical protein
VAPTQDSTGLREVAQTWQCHGVCDERGGVGGGVCAVALSLPWVFEREWEWDGSAGRACVQVDAEWEWEWEWRYPTVMNGRNTADTVLIPVRCEAGCCMLPTAASAGRRPRYSIRAP